MTDKPNLKENEIEQNKLISKTLKHIFLYIFQHYSDTKHQPDIINHGLNVISYEP